MLNRRKLSEAQQSFLSVKPDTNACPKPGGRANHEKLRLKDAVTAEEGYQDTVRTMARKLYPAIEGMRNLCSAC